MMTVLKTLTRRTACAVAILAPALILSGCYEDDYLSRRDTVSLGAGDAMATNAVTHTVDPWPAHSKNTDIHLEGERAGVAVERYQANQSLKPRGLSTTSGSGDANGGAKVTN